MERFFEAFWPDFASTVLGLFLGLPLALWAERRIASYSQRIKRQEEQRQFAVALQILTQTLTANRDRLRDLIRRLESGRVPFDTELDTSTWEAVKSEVTQHLQDPLLQGRIAYHFSRLGSVARLNNLYLNYAAGIAAAVGGSEKTRDALRNYLLQTAAYLDTDAEGIIGLIEAVGK